MVIAKLARKKHLESSTGGVNANRLLKLPGLSSLRRGFLSGTGSAGSAVGFKLKNDLSAKEEIFSSNSVDELGCMSMRVSENEKLQLLSARDQRAKPCRTQSYAFRMSTGGRTPENENGRACRAAHRGSWIGRVRCTNCFGRVWQRRTLP